MKTIALIFVDVQKDFIDGALKNEQAIAVTPKIVEFAKGIKAKMEANTGSFYKFYATRDTHKKTKYDMSCSGIPEPCEGYFATLEGQRLQKEHCIEGTDGWMIDNRLMDVFFAGYAKDVMGAEDTEHPIYNCTFVNKPTFGSEDLLKIIAEDFESTQLDEIVLCGFCTGICVLANAIALRMKFPNTKITVLKDLCACVTPESHDNALKALELQQIDIK